MTSTPRTAIAPTPSSARQRAAAAGFTLLELLITLAIVGILAGVALPNYRAYVQRATRVEAMTSLSDLALRQERYHLDHGAYAAAMGDLGFAPRAGSKYSYALLIGAGTFQVVATAIDSQLDDVDCRVFTMRSDGSRSAGNADGLDSTATCWK